MFQIEDKEKEIAKKAIEHYGNRAQIIKAIEELAELQVELAKHLNAQGTRCGILEEFADVYYMLYQLSVILKVEGIKSIIEQKADRLNNRIKKENNK